MNEAPYNGVVETNVWLPKNRKSRRECKRLITEFVQASVGYLSPEYHPTWIQSCGRSTRSPLPRVVFWIGIYTLDLKVSCYRCRCIFVVGVRRIFNVASWTLDASSEYIERLTTVCGALRQRSIFAWLLVRTTRTGQKTKIQNK